MGSSRLPGKVLMRAAGQTMLEHLLERLRFARSLDGVVVATTTDTRDDAIVETCSRAHTAVFRGSENDVLDRYYQAASSVQAGTVVRITSDCPLIDPNLVDSMVGFFNRHGGLYDLVTNRWPLTFPDGLDVDIMPITSLEDAWRNAATPHQREHVIPFFWECGRSVHNVECPENLFRTHRWTLDYPEDLALLRAIFEALYRPGRVFGMAEVLEFIARHPEVSKLNACYLPEAA